MALRIGTSWLANNAGRIIKYGSVAAASAIGGGIASQWVLPARQSTNLQSGGAPIIYTAPPTGGTGGTDPMSGLMNMLPMAMMMMMMLPMITRMGRTAEEDK